jgi:hypothetical protein
MPRLNFVSDVTMIAAHLAAGRGQRLRNLSVVRDYFLIDCWAACSVESTIFC